jgi:16S rRNA G1207 methylase RsmC
MFTGILHFLSNQTEEEEKRTRWKNQILLLTHSKKKKKQQQTHTHRVTACNFHFHSLPGIFQQPKRETALNRTLARREKCAR